MASPSNFVVSSSVMTKFGVLLKFDKHSKITKKTFDVIFCFRLLLSLKFRNSLFLDLTEIWFRTNSSADSKI